jgi:hypothetical protein
MGNIEGRKKAIESVRDLAYLPEDKLKDLVVRRLKDFGFKDVIDDDPSALFILNDWPENVTCDLRDYVWRTRATDCFTFVRDESGENVWRESLVGTDGAPIKGLGAESNHTFVEVATTIVVRRQLTDWRDPEFKCPVNYYEVYVTPVGLEKLVEKLSE